jgi:hypothetical protein
LVIAGVVQGLEEQPGPTALGGELWVERVIEFASQHLVFFASHLTLLNIDTSAPRFTIRTHDSVSAARGDTLLNTVGFRAH